jgi:hypothetical protein
VRRPPALLAPLAAAVAVLSACGDDLRQPAPTAPTAPRFSFSPGAACTRDDAQFLQQGIGALFSDPNLRREARARESTVEARCTDGKPQPYPDATAARTLASAPAAAVQYAGWLLNQRSAATVRSGDDYLWAYIVRLLDYVGYALPSARGSSGVFATSGFVRICVSGQICQVEAPDGRRGIRFPKFALSTLDSVPFLVTGVPVSCGPFGTPSTYTIHGACIDITVDPKPEASFALKESGTVVEVCTDHDQTPTYVYARRTDVYGKAVTTQGKLGQRSPRDAAAYAPISLRPYVAGFLSTLPQHQGKIDFCETPSSATTGGTGALGTLARAGDALLALFRPRVAYAGHGGLSTLPGAVSALSVFGPLDGYAFSGTFDQDAVGSFPSNTPEMREGTWKVNEGFPDPSLASVRFGGPFGSNYLLLNQAGGASPRTDSLVLTGTLGTAAASFAEDSDRVVRVRVRAAVLSTRAIGARFFVRSTLQRIAGFQFNDGQSAGAGTISAILPNGAERIGASTTASWSQNGTRDLQVTVRFNFNAPAETVVEIGLVGEVAPLARYKLNVADVASVSWVLAGRDGNTIGSDDYQVFDVPGGEP